MAMRVQGGKFVNQLNKDVPWRGPLMSAIEAGKPQVSIILKQAQASGDRILISRATQVYELFQKLYSDTQVAAQKAMKEAGY
jgi:hypothetical protein